ncbi:hypothetical protein YC2023_107419 [Brassica napus]
MMKSLEKQGERDFTNEFGDPSCPISEFSPFKRTHNEVELLQQEVNIKLYSGFHYSILGEGYLSPAKQVA